MYYEIVSNLNEFSFIEWFYIYSVFGEAISVKGISDYKSILQK